MSPRSNFEIRAAGDEASREYLHHSSAQRVNTDVVMVDTLRKQYPELKLTVARADLLTYAAAGHASYTETDDSESWSWRMYEPPARKIDGDTGVLARVVQFGKFLYRWRKHEFILYVINGRDGQVYSPQVTNSYILSTSDLVTDELLLEAAKYSSQLHNEVWVFDGGYWDKSRELFDSVQKAEWDDVILKDERKKNIIHDVEGFFDSRETYENLGVPWKRGIIFYGPPGNGKTISIKALMHDLYRRKSPAPTLYVRSLASFGGPEYALSRIFSKARQEAPCLLVFEDLDSIVNDSVRSYFLNEVDGLKKNDGILMIGSTNHIERLDPGISKRPSRFDRKYLFEDPDFDERVLYCHYWQHKLAGNKDIDFPDRLCNAIAEITDKFSFAYIQEAFVAALLTIAGRKDSLSRGEDKDIKDLLLWKEIQKQVKILRDELEAKTYGGGSPSNVRLVYR